MSTAALERETIDLLTGPEAGELLRLAVSGSAPAAPAGRHAAATAGETVTDWTTEVDSVHHRPGAGVSVGYKVSYAVAGIEVTEYLVASTAEVPDAPGVAVLQDGVRTLRVWRGAQDAVLRPPPHPEGGKAVVQRRSEEQEYELQLLGEVVYHPWLATTITSNSKFSD